MLEVRVESRGCRPSCAGESAAQEHKELQALLAGVGGGTEGEGGHRERHFSSVEGRASNTRPSHPASREEAESSCQRVEMHTSLEGCGQRPEPFLCCLPSQPLPWFQSFPGLESGTPQMEELAIGSPRPRRTLWPLPPWLVPFGPSVQLRLLCSCWPPSHWLEFCVGPQSCLKS